MHTHTHHSYLECYSVFLPLIPIKHRTQILLVQIEIERTLRKQKRDTYKYFIRRIHIIETITRINS